jgi:ribosomal protein L14E/L6E/L27E
MMKNKKRRKEATVYQGKWLSPAKENRLLPGQLVKSIQGRDAGSWYLVYSVEKNSVLAVNGRKRGVRNPKRKNCAHLQAVNKIAADLAQKLAEGKLLTDEEIRAGLAYFLEKEQG